MPVALALVRGRMIVPALLAGVTLHWLVNLPVTLLAMQAFGWPPETWQTIATLWLGGMTVVLALYAGSRLQQDGRPALLGEARCGACGQPFARSLVALNLGPWKLQGCAHCGRWQLI